MLDGAMKIQYVEALKQRFGAGSRNANKCVVLGFFASTRERSCR